MMSATEQVEALNRKRPRSAFLRGSGVALLILVAAAWFTGGFSLGDLFSDGSGEHVSRFLREARPFPVQKNDDWSEAGPWAGKLLQERGWTAAINTLAVAIAAIVLAGGGALLLMLPAARTLATPEPYLPSLRPPSPLRRAAWRTIVSLTRGLFIFLRAIPEYILAFLLMATLGGAAWPAVLALGLHNMGILGKLGAEVVENTDPAVPRALRSLGSSRSQIFVTALLPRNLPRFLLFFFYRWETCVREATVLGMLGLATLGYWIQEARAHFWYDEMLFFILLGAGLVLIGDVVSAVCRGIVRRAA